MPRHPRITTECKLTCGVSVIENVREVSLGHKAVVLRREGAEAVGGRRGAGGGRGRRPQRRGGRGGRR
ncbi:unnamed protein product [Arctia plantaginis]|uniref:Uncharacterized protein n=1 Tax=Arctia plantaginis TaxID=874455 RepID=A0A8S0ZKF0_ARCPL|nr:unnamed protein product [Arctia plantaginis]